MTVCAAALALLAALGATTPVGTAMHYDHAGDLAAVARVRHMPIAWGRIDGLAAVPSCALVQPAAPRFLLARFWERGAWGRWRRLQIVDCVQTRDRAAHARIGLVVETDRGTADAGGWAWNGTSGAGRTRVQVVGGR